ncbi:MAG: HipA domain-containing protein [Candidatus Fermentibacteria bacterium]|nr:HipA domain-containing protein [Candidatus Fermentibacteria bacterium]
MNRCPITYEECGGRAYSLRGLRLLNKKLTHLDPLPITAVEQRREALVRAGKMSIQGVQPKLSAMLSVKTSLFQMVDTGGRYILKPQHSDYPELPENEGVSMHMAAMAGMDVPLNGMIYSKDGSLTYFIKRFDRYGRAAKLAVEDFAQLSGRDRNTKYGSSMEKVTKLLDRYCTFPAVEKLKLFRRTLFSYLIGNEDTHLKNLSLVRRNHKIELTPMYDYLNTTIALQAMGKRLEQIEELALPLRGKKQNLSRRDFIDYFGKERLHLTDKVISNCLKAFETVQPGWIDILGKSFMSDDMKTLYSELLLSRCAVLKL